MQVPLPTYAAASVKKLIIDEAETARRNLPNPWPGKKCSSLRANVKDVIAGDCTGLCCWHCWYRQGMPLS